jgi:hypothetical protein
MTKASESDAYVAKEFINELRQNKFDQLEANMNSVLIDDNVTGTLTQMAALFPNENPLSVKTVGWHKNMTSGNSMTSTTLEYEFPKKWLLVDLTTQTISGDTKIVGFHVTTLKTSEENANRFTLKGKNVEQYTVLFLAILSPLFALYAFVMCIKTQIEKLKWLWMIGTLLGIGQYGVNWTTGQSVLSLFFVRIPPGGANADAYGPWIIYAALPVGAIYFLYNRQALIAKARQNIKFLPMTTEAKTH